MNWENNDQVGLFLWFAVSGLDNAIVAIVVFLFCGLDNAALNNVCLLKSVEH